LEGRVTSRNVSDLLNSFNVDVHNFIASKGEANFNLSWHDMPFVPSLSTMNGFMTIELGQGRIVDLGQASGAKMDVGRMLSIFSLQTIPRRVSFDFSDIFQKGYSFDSMQGDFNFRDGNAFTSNSRIEGTVANVVMNGRIGFKDKDYDLALSIMPHVTSSIPVAATLITLNPLVGVAAWAVNKVTSPIISKATSYTYAINGPWNNPNWETIS
jgi:uncharacterized protein YhdP